MPKSERKKLEDAIHKVQRELCLKEHDYCVVCKGESGNEVLQAGHVISAKRKSVKYLSINVHTQCQTCNWKHSNGYPELYINWFVNEYGQDTFDKMVELSRETKKYTIPELEELLAIYKQILRTSKLEDTELF